MEITDEVVAKINEEVENCYWKQDAGGVPICTGNCLPCSVVIDKGQCDTIISILRGKDIGE